MVSSKTRLALCSTLLLAACGSPSPIGGDDADDDWHDCCDARPDDPTIDGGGDGDPDGGTEPDPDATIPPPDGSPSMYTVCASGADYTSIGAAIAALPLGGSVQVCAGTFPERLSITDRSIELYGAGAGLTIIDAGGAGTALAVSGSHALTIEGITIRGGSTRGVTCTDSTLTVRASAMVDNTGGGFSTDGCVVDISGTTFTNNKNSVGGGAGYLKGSMGVIAGSTFTSNQGEEGGALYFEGGTVNVSASTFTMNHSYTRGGAIYQMGDGATEDSTFTNNSSGWTAGAIYVWQHHPAFRRNTIDHNVTAWEGGGMYLHQSQAILEENHILYNQSEDDGGGLRIFESTLHVERNIIEHNTSTDGDGGAFKISHMPSVFIDNQLLDNWALGAGGGAEFDNDSSQWHGGIIARNHASIGGGLHAMRWPWNDGIIEGVEITGNDAWRGGGIYTEEHFFKVTLRGLWIHDNVAHQAAGVYFRGTPLDFSNSVVEGNVADDLGGGIEYAPNADYPWGSEPCPCPPIDPPGKISFVVVHGNTADSGAGAWIKAPNVTITDSIFSGHTATAILVDQPDPMVSTTPVWTYNNVYPATFAGMTDPTGSSGNMASAPGYVSATDFHLDANSPLKDKADPALHDLDGSRADMGAYAGPTPMP